MKLKQIIFLLKNPKELKFIKHQPTDSRLDYCRCGESWPCSKRN